MMWEVAVVARLSGRSDESESLDADSLPFFQVINARPADDMKQAGASFVHQYIRMLGTPSSFCDGSNLFQRKALFANERERTCFGSECPLQGAVERFRSCSLPDDKRRREQDQKSGDETIFLHAGTVAPGLGCSHDH